MGGLTLTGQVIAAPKLWHAIQACEDRYCVQLTVEGAKPDSYIDVRTTTGGPILKSFTGTEIVREQRGKFTVMTVRIEPSLQSSFNNAPEGLLFWIVNPGDGFDGFKSVRRSTTRGTAARFGGSNYTWYRNPGAPNNCDREPYGILKTYHLMDPDHPGTSVRTVVREQLQTLHEAGQRAIRIGIVAHYGYDEDSYVDVSNGLKAQYKQNLQNWIADIEQAGFEQIHLGIFPVGDLDPKNWNTFQSARFQAYWKTVQDIFSIFDEETWPVHERIFVHGFQSNKPAMPAEFYVGLGNEQLPRATSVGSPNSPDKPILSQFARDLWALYVSTYPSGRSIGFSSRSLPLI